MIYKHFKTEKKLKFRYCTEYSPWCTYAASNDSMYILIDSVVSPDLFHPLIGRLVWSLFDSRQRRWRSVVFNSLLHRAEQSSSAKQQCQAGTGRKRLSRDSFLGICDFISTAPWSQNYAALTPMPRQESVKKKEPWNMCSLKGEFW